MIIAAPNQRINLSAPVVKRSAVLSTRNDEVVQSVPRLTAFIRPTGSNHRVFYTVEVTINHDSGGCSIEEHRVRPDNILNWVSLTELTRFEHLEFLDEQARESSKLLRQRQRRARKRPSTIQPLGPVEETEASTNDDSQDAFKASSTPHPGLKRPRGRPRKQLFSVQIHSAYKKDRGSLAVPTISHKRRRESSEFAHGSDEIISNLQRDEVNKLVSSGKSSRRQDANFQHVSLPQVKKRVKKSEYRMFSISSQSDVNGPSVPAFPTLSREAPASAPSVSQRSASEDSMLEIDPFMIYNPVIAYSDHDGLDAQFPKRLSVANGVDDVVAASSNSADLTQRRSDAITPTDVSPDPQSSDENALADVSSDEDELADLQTQFNATPTNRLPQPTNTTPRTTIRISKRPLSVISSSGGQEDISIPPQGREASLDLGAPSSSEESMRQSPFRIQTRPSPHQDATAANQIIDQSSDSMMSSPMRLQSRPVESHRPTVETEVVELSSDEASDKNKDSDQSVVEDESEAESEATIDHHATEPEDAYADLVIPEVLSSQSFRHQASSVSSEEFTNVVLQQSEAQATTRRAHVNTLEVQGPRGIPNGTSRPKTRNEHPIIRSSDRAPIQRTLNIPIQSRAQDSEVSSGRRRGQPQKPAAAKQLHTATSPQQQHRLHRNAINTRQPKQEAPPMRLPNPFQQFSQNLHAPTQADSLASMGAGQTFTSKPTTQHRRGSSAASLVDSSTHNNPYGRPLPLHPVTPPIAVGHSRSSHVNTDTNGVKVRSTTQKRSRQSMTPLFPRRAIIPDLTASSGSPTKRKEKILSTQQFQA